MLSYPILSYPIPLKDLYGTAAKGAEQVRITIGIWSQRVQDIDDLVSVRSLYPPPRETSDRAMVIKKEQKQGGQPGNRKCRTVRAYGTQKHRWEKTI
jgi:hypothetical protein